MLELLVDQAVTQNRPGDQLRKDRNIGREVDKAFGRFSVAPIDVDDVAQRLEHVEGDPQRQDDVLKGEGIDTQWLQYCDEHVGTEVGVLEVAQGGQVTDNPNG